MIPVAQLVGCAASDTTTVSNSAELLAGTCAPCHGPRGHSRDLAIPSLAGRPALSLETALQQYRDGLRGETAMTRLALALNATESRQVSLWFEAQGGER